MQWTHKPVQLRNILLLLLLLQMFCKISHPLSKQMYFFYTFWNVGIKLMCEKLCCQISFIFRLPEKTQISPKHVSHWFWSVRLSKKAKRWWGSLLAHGVIKGTVLQKELQGADEDVNVCKFPASWSVTVSRSAHLECKEAFLGLPTRHLLPALLETIANTNRIE